MTDADVDNCGLSEAEWRDYWRLERQRKWRNERRRIAHTAEVTLLTLLAAYGILHIAEQMPGTWLSIGVVLALFVALAWISYRLQRKYRLMLPE